MTETHEEEGSGSDPQLTQTLAADRRCCGNCVSWDGTRKFIKRFPQGQPSIDHPAVFFTRVADKANGHCLAPGSIKHGKEMLYSATCLQFKAFFKGTQADPNMALVHLNQACCATCSWWEGERKLIKKEERDRDDRVTRKAYFLRIERDRSFRCVNLTSRTSSMYMSPIQHCDHYRYLFT